MRKQKTTRAIEIKEDMKIPGTDIVLEAGDRIRVSESGFFKDISWYLTIQKLVQKHMKDGPEDLGREVAYALIKAIRSEEGVDAALEAADGLEDGLREGRARMLDAKSRQ